MLDVNRAPHLVHLVVALREQSQVRLSLLVHKVLQDRIGPEVIPPLQVVHEHRLGLLKVVVPRPEEPTQVIVVEHRTAPHHWRDALQLHAIRSQQRRLPFLCDSPQLLEAHDE